MTLILDSVSSIQLVASSKGWATNPASFCFSLNHLLWWKHLIIVSIILTLVLIQPQTLICIYTYVMKNMLRMLPHKCPLLYSKPSWFYPLNYCFFIFIFISSLTGQKSWIIHDSSVSLTGTVLHGRQLWSSSPKFTLHYPLRLIVFEVLIILLLCSNPTVVPIACAKSSLETLPVLSTSPQKDLPVPFLFRSPHFTHPFPPFGIRSSMFSVISHWGCASGPAVYGGVSFGAQVYSIPSVKLRFEITAVFWSGLGFTLLKS